MKNKQGVKVHRIHLQIAGGLSLLVSLIVVALFLLNTFFLEDMYVADKAKAMENTFHLVNGAAAENYFNDQRFLTELEKEYENHNLSIAVLSSDGSTILSTEQDSGLLFSEFLYTIFQQDFPDGDQVLQSTDNFVLQYQTDRRLGEKYLVLWGTLDNGNLMMIRSAVESIRESARISNRFLFAAGLAAVFVSVVVGWFLTKQITRPIEELTRLSEQMTRLDFDARYISRKKKNEIDILGECMNTMSSALEDTIVELKQANYDLKRDIAVKEANEKRQKEFITNISHELKTPLAVIRGYAEGLQEGISDGPNATAFYCDVIQDEAEKMNRMVLSMISLTQIESGNSNLTYERFDLTAMIQNMLQEFAVLLEQNQITLRFEPKEPVAVYADESLVEQVVSNYLSNAIHYAKYQKEIIISFMIKEHAVRVTVFNTGDPIPWEALPKLWDRFYKVDEARTRDYGGTGIGLSIVKAIMEEFKQAYGVANQEDGVAFWFELEH